MSKTLPKITDNQKWFIREVLSDWYKGLHMVPDTMSRTDLCEITEAYDDSVKFPAWITQTPDRRRGRGVYFIGDVVAEVRAEASEDAEESEAVGSTYNNTLTATEASETVETAGHAASVKTANNLRVRVADSMAVANEYIPARNPNFFEFGHFSFIHKIIRSREFFPIWVSGLSGNGKTLMIQQACAKAKRECIRVNITGETDEDTLFGGFRLLNGETVFQKGPVIEAMERGAVLLLDEVDLGIPSRIMCLQPVLEGGAVFLSKIGERIDPQPGFQIFATANTQGRGNDTGAFVGTNVLNAAMLDRFCSGVVQDYPPKGKEIQILQLYADNNGIDIAPEYVECLVGWADQTRKSYLEGACEEIITTRRLVNTLRLVGILGTKTTDPAKTRKIILDAVQNILSNFPPDSRDGFFKSLQVMLPDLSKKITGQNSSNTVNNQKTETEYPF